MHFTDYNNWRVDYDQYSLQLDLLGKSDMQKEYIECNEDHLNSVEVTDVYWFTAVQNLSQNFCLVVVFFSC